MAVQAHPGEAAPSGGTDLLELKQRLGIPPQDTTVERALLFHRGRALEGRQFDEAVSAYRKFIEVAPHEPVGYVRLAALYRQHGLRRPAADVYVALGEVYAARGRWERAALAYERAVEQTPDGPAALGALRDAYIKLGRVREASGVQARLDAVVSAIPAPEPSPPPPDAPAGAAGVTLPDTARPRPGDRKARAGSAGPEPPRTKDQPGPALPPLSPDGQAPAPAAGPAGRRRARSEPLAQILLNEGMVTREQLDRAIQMQQRSGGHLGRILVDLQALSEEDLARALSIQWGLAFADLSALTIDRAVVKLIPQHLALRHKVLAIERTRNRLRLGIADPLNVIALDDVRLVTGLEIEPVIVPEEQITAAIHRLYTEEFDMDAALRQAVNGELETVDDRAEEISLDRLRTLVEEAPVVRLVNLIINQAIDDGASDIHIEPQRRSVQVRYRVDGILRDVMAPPKSLQQAMISRIKIMANLDIAERRVPQDGRVHVVGNGKEYDLRVSTLPTVFGEKVVMRILDQSTARLELNRLGFSAAALEIWQEIISKPYGMILVSGPTGSGKTTTLYSTLHRLNTADKNILTVEDPVEYQLPRVNQVQVNPRAGVTFASALRSFLRQDPDIIMVGEIRDRETAEIAIQASLTGHLVLSTIHTNDAPSATTRLIDMGVEPFLISSSLIGVLAQRLVRTICRHCAEAYRPPVEALHRLGLAPEEGEDVVFHRGRGCERCKGSGYRGRIGVFELMVMSDAIRELVLRGAAATEIRAQAVGEGMRTLRDDGTVKVLEGVTTVDELLRVVFVDV